MRQNAFDTTSLTRIPGFVCNRFVSMFSYGVFLQMIGSSSEKLPFFFIASMSVFLAVGFLCLIGASVKKLPALTTSRYFIPGIALLTLFGLTLMIYLRTQTFLGMENLLLFLGSAISLSIGSAGLFFCWGVQFSKSDSKKTLAEMGVGFVVALILLAPFNFLTLPMQGILLIGACIVDVFLLHKASKGDRIMPQKNLLRKNTIWVRKKMYTGMACYGAAMGLSTSLLPHTGQAVYLSDSIARMICGVVIFAVAATVIRLFKKESILATYRLAYLIIALNTATLLFLADKDPFFLAILFVGHLLIIATCMSLLFGIAHKVPADHIQIITFGVAAFLFGDLLMRGLHDMLALTNAVSSDTLELAFTIALMCMVILSYAVIFTERDISRVENITNDIVATENLSESTRPPQEVFIEAIVYQYKLTPRETDVLSLMLIGRSSPRIQSELFISESTVHTHIRHIYNKMTIRSRQELIDLYAEWEENKNIPVP